MLPLCCWWNSLLKDLLSWVICAPIPLIIQLLLLAQCGWGCGGCESSLMRRNLSEGAPRGEMFTFGYSHDPPYITYRVISKDGIMQDPVPITIPEPIMMHDFAITENYAIMMDLPLCFRPKVRCLPLATLTIHLTSLIGLYRRMELCRTRFQ
ncbi:hypothetical protein P3L10_012955 [Capsicum annuum]